VWHPNSYHERLFRAIPSRRKLQAGAKAAGRRRAQRDRPAVQFGEILAPGAYGMAGWHLQIDP
jgi:hypothetical protein